MYYFSAYQRYFSEFQMLEDNDVLYSTHVDDDGNLFKLEKKYHHETNTYFMDVGEILDHQRVNKIKAKEALFELQNLHYETEFGNYYSSDEYLDILFSMIENITELNNTLNEKDKVNDEIEDLSKLKILQEKKFVSPKELSILLPDMSISQQQTYRGRINDKIPYNQKTERGKVVYEVNLVMNWMKENHIGQ
ncbi:MAG: hypothetical protein Q9M32_08335 [Sulfurimonas sp.]|nr:hypothetical protein [Sulfurimonas sp.]